jgi:hypothetical protein
MRPALRELNEWLIGPISNWQALMMTTAPEGLIRSGVARKTYTYGYMLDAYLATAVATDSPGLWEPDVQSALTAAGVPILEAIAAEGFGVLAALGAANPPYAIRVAHEKVVACGEFEYDRANARVDLITRGIIADLGQDPCRQLPEALAGVEQYVRDYQ